LRPACRHERVAKVELNRRNIRFELNRSLQHVDGFGGPARTDQTFALVGQSFGLAGC
jgi:hypothetical protein